MPSIADLNVRLGLIYKDLDKGLEGVERKLRSSGRRLSDLGDQMTVALSLPLAAAGAAAVKTAGDIESLQLALESQLGSTEAARKELELLRQEALKPGLGFEQAVRGSVSLQAVGFAADKARKIISEFGNGLALAGKGAQELDGVILALTQIQSKGIVSAEEINQIAERLPQIRTLMQAAFGTASSEAIQKLGISSQQFIEGITAQLEKLPRATGGIKNSLENFFDAIKLGAAKFGEAISKALDLPATLDKISSGLSSVAESFSNLDAGTQKTIVQFGLFAVAAGPAIKVVAALKTTTAQAIDIFQGFAGGVKTMSGWVITAAASFQKLNLAMKFTVAGAVLAGVTALYFAFENLHLSVSATGEVMKEAAATAAEQRTRSEYLIEVLRDENAGYKEKQGALKKLNEIAPEYFKGLSIEKSSIEDLNKAYDGYIDSILRAARAKAAEDKLVELDKKAIEVLERKNRLIAAAADRPNQGATIGFGAGAIDMQAKNTRDELIKRAEAEEAAVKKEMDALKGLIKANTDWGQVVDENKDKNKDLTAEQLRIIELEKQLAAARKGDSKAIKEQSGELDIYLDGLQKQESLQNKIRQAAASMGLAPLESLPQAGTGPVESIKPPAGPEFSTFAAGLTTALTPAEALLDALNSKLFTFNELFALTSEGVAANGTVMQQAILAAASAMSEAAASGASSLGALASAAVGSAAKIVRAWIQQGVAAAVAKALSGLPFPFNIAAGAAAGALAAGAFNKVLNAIKVPGFAQGTNFAPGGMALVGERGPELVSLPRGSQVTPNNRLSGMMGGSNVTVGGTFRISGPDLLVVLEKAQSQQRRVRGY